MAAAGRPARPCGRRASCDTWALGTWTELPRLVGLSRSEPDRCSIMRCECANYYVVRQSGQGRIAAIIAGALFEARGALSTWDP